MRPRGFTLIELMSALLILALLALMSFRGLAAVLESRERVSRETAKWKNVAAFFSRFQRDVQLSAPRPVLASAGRFEFSRFSAADGIDLPRRVAYRLTEDHDIELSLSPEPALARTARPTPVRYVVLAAVARFELQYLDPGLAWVGTWPRSERDAALPEAVRLRVVHASGEELVRVFALK
jgi:general secretion pathway protein J